MKDTVYGPDSLRLGQRTCGNCSRGFVWTREANIEKLRRRKIRPSSAAEAELINQLAVFLLTC